MVQGEAGTRTLQPGKAGGSGGQEILKFEAIYISVLALLNVNNSASYK